MKDAHDATRRGKQLAQPATCTCSGSRCVLPSSATNGGLLAFPPPQVGGWVRLMPNLRRLGLYSYDEAGHQKLIATSALAASLRLEVRDEFRLLVLMHARRAC